MEELEILKQENAKLNARLNKAVEVFKEQKANLDNLTSQVESLQKELETYKNAPVVDVSEYENKITLLEEKVKQNLEVSKNYNDQLLTIDELTKQNEEVQKEYELSEKQIAKLMDFQSFQSNQITTLQTEKESLYKQIDEYELKLQDSETTYEQLHKKYEERKKQVAELMGSQAANVETIKKEYESKITSLKDDINKKTQEIENLQIEKSNIEVNTNEEIKKVTAARDELIIKYKELVEKDNELNKTIESKDKAHKVLQETYNEVFNELNNLKETNTKNINLYNDLKEKFDQQKEGCQKLEDVCVSKDKEIEILKKDLADSLLKLEANDKYKQFVEAMGELAESVNITWKKPETPINKETSKKIGVMNPLMKTNSTGNQFMTDATGMNI